MKYLVVLLLLWAPELIAQEILPPSVVEAKRIVAAAPFYIRPLRKAVSYEARAVPRAPNDCPCRRV